MIWHVIQRAADTVGDKTELAATTAFWWGCVGGLMAWVAGTVLPEFRRMANEGTFKFTAARLVGFLGIGASLVALGGGVAVWVGNSTDAKQAIANGIAAEALILAGGKIAKP